MSEEAVKDDGGLDRDVEEIEEGVLRSAGLSSGVVEDGDEHVGHVLMADYDGNADALTIRDETDLVGINALLRSSEGSFHYYNLSVRELDDQLVTALRLHGDPQHVASSARRGYFVLRWTGKVFASGERAGERYKDAPELFDVWTTGAPEEWGAAQSRPHVEALRTRAEEDGLGDVVDDLDELLEHDSIDFAGESVILSKYQTMTDDLKADVRGDP